MATTEVLDAEEHPEWAEKVRLPGYRAQVERIVVFRVVAFDWNCPQHITPRYTEEELRRLEPQKLSSKSCV